METERASFPTGHEVVNTQHRGASVAVRVIWRASRQHEPGVHARRECAAVAKSTVYEVNAAGGADTGVAACHRAGGRQPKPVVIRDTPLPTAMYVPARPACPQRSFTDLRGHGHPAETRSAIAMRQKGVSGSNPALAFLPISRCVYPCVARRTETDHEKSKKVLTSVPHFRW